MQTKCPKCASVLEVTEELLTVANGKVRCGDCNTIFDGRENVIQAEKNALDSIEDALFSLESAFEEVRSDNTEATSHTQTLLLDEEVTQTVEKQDLSDLIGAKAEPYIEPQMRPKAPPARPGAQIQSMPLGDRIAVDEAPAKEAPKPTEAEPAQKEAPPKIDIPEIDIDLDSLPTRSSVPGTPETETSQTASKTSVHDMIEQFMEAEEKEESTDPTAAHTMEIDDIIAKSGIIVEDESSNPFEDLLDKASVTNISEDTDPDKTISLEERERLFDNLSFDANANLDEDIADDYCAESELHKLFQQTDDRLTDKQAKEAKSHPAPDLFTEPPEPFSPSSSTNSTALNNDSSPTEKKKSKLPLLGVMACLVLIAGFCLQALYAARYTLANNPKYTDFVVSACRYIPSCDLKSPQAYQLIGRQMTAHAAFEDVLILEITLKNTAKFDQPLPKIMVSMTDNLSRQIAQNVFDNDAYEGGDIWMKAGQTRTLKILLKDPDERATGFEVGFE